MKLKKILYYPEQSSFHIVVRKVVGSATLSSGQIGHFTIALVKMSAMELR